MPVPTLSTINAKALAERQKEALAKNSTQTVYNDPLSTKDRIRIIADDSSSMFSIAQEMRDGIVEFMKHCVFNETSAAVNLMNGTLTNPENSDGQLSSDKQRLSQLTTNLPALSILVQGIKIGGYTPMATALDTAMNHGDATRYILFSDGEPDPGERAKLPSLARRAKEARTPIDTVYIAHHTYSDAAGNAILDTAGLLLKEIADLSGGIFLHYQKGVGNFGKIFGYLAPPQRLMLADPAFKSKLEQNKL